MSELCYGSVSVKLIEDQRENLSVELNYSLEFSGEGGGGGMTNKNLEYLV